MHIDKSRISLFKSVNRDKYRPVFKKITCNASLRRNIELEIVIIWHEKIVIFIYKSRDRSHQKRQVQIILRLVNDQYGKMNRKRTKHLRKKRNSDNKNEPLMRCVVHYRPCVVRQQPSPVVLMNSVRAVKTRLLFKSSTCVA